MADTFDVSFLLDDSEISELEKLDAGDTEKIKSTESRFRSIADTLQDAITSLGKIVDGKTGSLKGQYVSELQEDAADIKKRLEAANKRYQDAVDQMAIYEPKLETAQTDVKNARGAAEDASKATTTANALPDGQPDSNGVLSAEEQAKNSTKKTAQDKAAADMTAAKTKLTNALAALQVAGKTFGDAVNCNMYDGDGLTDSGWDKFLAFLKSLSQVLGWIAFGLAALAMIFIGIPALATALGILGVIVSGMLLLSDFVLFTQGQATWRTLLMDIFGLGFGIVGMFAGKISAFVSKLATFFKNDWNAGLMFKVLSSYKGGITATPQEYEMGAQAVAALPASEAGMGKAFMEWMSQLKELGNSATWTNFMKNWYAATMGTGTASELGFLTSIPYLGQYFTRGAQGAKMLWGFYNLAVNIGWNVGASVIFGALQIAKIQQLDGF